MMMKNINIELEKLVFASLRYGAKELSEIEVIQKISPDDFTNENFKEGISIIKELWDKGEKINPLTILNSYKRKNGHELMILFNSEMHRLVDNILHVPLTEVFSNFLMLRQQTAIRKINEIELKRVERLKNITDPFIEIETQQKENEEILSFLNSLKKLKHIKDYIVYNLEKYFKTNINEYNLGLYKLDKNLIIERGDLVILACRPGMGKTALSLFFARNFVKSGKRVLFFSLEMTGEKIMTRIQCGESGIPLYKYKYKKMTETEFMNFKKVSGEIAEWTFVLDAESYQLSDIISISKIENQRGVDIIIIDYMGLILSQGRKENRNIELGEISRALKILAKELNIPIISLHQLNRMVENRSDKRPMLADLRDSGAIEQDADVVMFIYREDYYRKDNEKSNETELIIAKNREGESNKSIIIGNNEDLTNFYDNKSYF